MAKRRQPSGAFVRRLKAYSEPNPAPVVKPVTWIRKLRESDGWLWGEVIGFFGVVAGLIGFVFALVGFWIDLQDRQTQRVVQAWQLVTQNSPGNSGKGPALEYLNSQGVPLVGIDLSVGSSESPSYLRGIDLSGADLVFAILSRADLFEADLSGANLHSSDLTEAFFSQANLSGANLYNANLSGADLTDANLSGADLSWSNLSMSNLSKGGPWPVNLVGADLNGADLSGAKLMDVRNLSQNQLDTACGDEKTQLPNGLAIKACPKY